MILYIIIGFAVGFLTCMIISYLHYLRTARRRRRKTVSIDTFAKLVVAAVVAHGMILTTLSYILSFVDKDPVCSVSEVIVKEIVAPVLVYLATNMIMNIFEKNKMAFSVPISSTIIGADGERHTYSGATDSFVGEPDDNNVG